MIFKAVELQIHLFVPSCRPKANIMNIYDQRSICSMLFRRNRLLQYSQHLEAHPLWVTVRMVLSTV
jgi:hypothetical protein